MQRRRLGKSAIVVSDICMGTMTFGNQADEADACGCSTPNFDAGIDFYDTAEGYPVPPDPKWVGRTEEIVGKWLKTKPRDASSRPPRCPAPATSGSATPSGKAWPCRPARNIMVAVEDSLRKLGTDYIDLHQTHWPDHDLPYGRDDGGARRTGPRGQGAGAGLFERDQLGADQVLRLRKSWARRAITRSRTISASTTAGSRMNWRRSAGWKGSA